MWLLAVIFASVLVDRTEPVENPVTNSANGRFSTVVRWHHGVPDFTSALPTARETDWRNVTVALYALPARRLVAEIPVAWDHLGDVLVSDAGHVVAIGRMGRSGCVIIPPQAKDRLVTVFRPDGSLAGALEVGDVINAYDLEHLFATHLTFALRRENDGRQVFVVGVPEKNVERRIDVATVKLLDVRTDIWERPRVHFTPMEVTATIRPLEGADCELMFEDPSITWLDSILFLDRAMFTPVPDYPILARKARIHGTVRVRVLVSRDGDVLCVRSSALPFGLSEAAGKAVRSWHFLPSRTPFAGEVLFHFTK